MSELRNADTLLVRSNVQKIKGIIKRIVAFLKCSTWILVRRVVRYSFLGIICLYGEVALASLGFLNVFDKDILYLTLEHCLKVGGLLTLILLSAVLFSRNISSLHIWIKKHHSYIQLALTFVEMVCLFKCETRIQTQLFFVEFVCIGVLLDYETSKVFKYNLRDKIEKLSSYIERPIVGRENLTSSQCKALDQLETVIDKRSCIDSFNIGLIGEWGSGKTSVTDTLISEYQGSHHNQYFVLKISTLSIRETKNIVVYVKKYFEDLFRNYEIGLAKRNVAFLTSLANSFSDNFSIGKILTEMRDDNFSDMEKEKELFTRQVARLLKLSGRKNIIFVIDDTDRNEDEAEITKLLSEFASIAGIISIVSLDSSKDKIVRPNSSKEKTNLAKEEIDKYIHIRVRIEMAENIEYDNNITKQIISSYEGIASKENYLIYYGDNDRKSMLDVTKNYNMKKVVPLRTQRENTYNILTDLFFVNLRIGKLTFWEYIGRLINEYIMNTKELYELVRKTLTSEIWDKQFYMINIDWKMLTRKEDFYWVERILINVKYLFSTTYSMVKNISLMKQINKKAYSLETLFDSIETADILYFKTILLNEREQEKLDKLICVEEYGIVKNFLFVKMQGIYNLYYIFEILADFLQYLREILNNYRLFKMQLREAEMLNMNYLDYLIREWQPREALSESIWKIRKEDEMFNELDKKLPTLNSFINNVLLENYILQFGERFDNNELKYSRIFLYKTNNKTNIVIMQKKDEDENLSLAYYLDSLGNSIDTISKEDWEKIMQKARDLNVE